MEENEELEDNGQEKIINVDLEDGQRALKGCMKIGF